MTGKVCNKDIDRFNLDSSDATLILGIIGVTCYLLGFFMGIVL